MSPSSPLSKCHSTLNPFSSRWSRHSMKKLIYSVALWWSFSVLVHATEDEYTKASWHDGLPGRLAESHITALGTKTFYGVTDLTPAFKELGVPIAEGESVIYEGGALIRHLKQSGHDLVDHILERLYRTDTQIATCKAYLKLFSPLSADDRLDTALRIGFLPDPLVAGVIDEIRRLRRRAQPRRDPFASEAPEAQPFTDEEKTRLKRLERRASLLLESAVRNLKDQLEAIEQTEAEQGAAGQPATRPESNLEGKQKP